MSPIRRQIIAGVALSAFLAAGCGRPSDGPWTAADADDLWQWALSNATNASASESQLSVLQQASDSGTLSQDDLLGLLDETFACFELHDIPYGMDEPDSVVPGVTIPRYHFGEVPGLSPEESLQIADHCIDENSLYAEMAYQQQPSFQESINEQQLLELPEALLCLRDEGVEIDDDATLDEVRTETRRLIMRQIEARQDPVYCLSSYEP